MCIVYATIIICIYTCNVGKAAYFRQEQKHKPIYDTDYGLWQLLSAKNKSITTNTTYSDVYYASMTDVSSLY